MINSVLQEKNRIRFKKFRSTATSYHRKNNSENNLFVFSGVVHAPLRMCLGREGLPTDVK